MYDNSPTYVGLIILKTFMFFFLTFFVLYSLFLLSVFCVLCFG